MRYGILGAYICKKGGMGRVFFDMSEEYRGEARGWCIKEAGSLVRLAVETPRK